MTPDLTICRTHNRQTEGDRCPSFLVSRIGECVIVRLVWSADGHTLVEVVECEKRVLGPCPDRPYGDSISCLVAHWIDCPKCGGSGWRYKADIMTGLDGQSLYAGSGRVAVVPLKDDA